MTAHAFEMLPFDLEAYLSLPDIRDYMEEDLKEELRRSDRKRETVESILMREIPDELSRRILIEVKTKHLKEAEDNTVRAMNGFFRKITPFSSFSKLTDSILMF